MHATVSEHAVRALPLLNISATAVSLICRPRRRGKCVARVSRTRSVDFLPEVARRRLQPGAQARRIGVFHRALVGSRTPLRPVWRDATARAGLAIRGVGAPVRDHRRRKIRLRRAVERPQVRVGPGRVCHVEGEWDLRGVVREVWVRAGRADRRVAEEVEERPRPEHEGRWVLRVHTRR